jgi:hypothetical protein
MRRKLMITCPQCEGGNSKYFREIVTCGYCGGSEKVNILDHHKILGITDERAENVRTFVNDPRFVEYLETIAKKKK